MPSFTEHSSVCAGAGGVMAGAAGAAGGGKQTVPAGGRKQESLRKAEAPSDPFIRAENEDDDGYDPYSDRLPEPEPLFERDPWG